MGRVEGIAFGNRSSCVALGWVEIIIVAWLYPRFSGPRIPSIPLAVPTITFPFWIRVSSAAISARSRETYLGHRSWTLARLVRLASAPLLPSARRGLLETHSSHCAGVYLLDPNHELAVSVNALSVERNNLMALQPTLPWP